MNLLKMNMTVPSVKHHSMYITFWKNIYDDIKQGNLSIDYNQIEKYKHHLAIQFEKLRHIKDDDFF